MLLSWAVPKGPSLDTHDKRLAVHVEDHPIPYADFEGTIPAGEYGGGTVLVWDTGTWEPVGDPHAGLAKGDLKFDLRGSKLQGRYVLVHMKPRPGEKREMWLLIKERDEFVRPREEFDVIAEQPDSAVTGRSLEKSPPRRRSRPTSPTPRYPHLPPLATRQPRAPRRRPPPRPRSTPRSTSNSRRSCCDRRSPKGWLAEVKYDGYRAAIALSDGHARAFTRSHADWTDRFAPACARGRDAPDLLGGARRRGRRVR